MLVFFLAIAGYSTVSCRSLRQVHGQQSASTLHHVKDYMTRLRCDYDKQLVRLQRAVQRERQM